MDGQVDADGGAFVEHHLNIHTFFEVAEGVAELRGGKFVLVEVFLVHKVVAGAVGVEILRFPMVHFGQAECGIVALEGALYHGAVNQVPHFDAGNRGALLHLVPLVVHYLPGLVVQLDDHALVQVAKVDAHSWYPLGVPKMGGAGVIAAPLTRRR